MESIEYLRFEPYSNNPPWDYSEDDYSFFIQGDEVLNAYLRAWGVEGSYIQDALINDGGINEVLNDCIKEWLPLVKQKDNGEYEPFVLTFKVTPSVDYESGRVDDWDCDLIGVAVQDGNNLVVNPIVG